jgi:hypothetical protein
VQVSISPSLLGKFQCGGPFNVTAALSHASGPAPTGNVTFTLAHEGLLGLDDPWSSPVQLGSAPLDPTGTATLSVAPLTPPLNGGVYRVQASQAGATPGTTKLYVDFACLFGG